MIDLTDIAGVTLSLTDTHELAFAEPMSQMAESVRRVDSLAAVWMDPSVRGQEEIYRVYWGAYPSVDQAAFEEYGLDHAYVVLFPGCHGQEYTKTQGHYHPPAAGLDASTPELYKVLHGHGYFLLQRSSPPYARVEDVVLVEVAPGDVFHVAPNYGHLAVNLGDEALVFEAFLSANLAPITEPYRSRRGGSHYVVCDNGESKVAPNPRYVDLPALRRTGNPHLPYWEEQWGNILYPWVVQHMQGFLFLRDPSQFDPDWTV